ncbi:CGA synthase-related protein [Kitasatospora sp. NPDC094019]|uniref:CGA synthase-related protein n=1 Tax=Kitasatospora sp. NPDC094019 TaxID=3364091 RepID=UPI0038015164
MAVLTTGTVGPATGPTVLLACREQQLDSVLALRRVAAHLGDLPRSTDNGHVLRGHALPGAALVCDEEATTARLARLGVPVLHLRSAPGAALAPLSADRLLARAQWPGWLEHPGGDRPTGLLAPVRLSRRRERRGTLLLLSFWDVPPPEAEAFAAGPLPALVREAVRRTGSCAVVGDTGLDRVRDATARLPGVTVDEAAAADADDLHARAELLLASPTLAAVALAQARRAPLAFLPALGAAQRDLAERVTRLVPVPVATDPTDPDLWQPPPAEEQWGAVGPGLDDLRGAQGVARTVRQLLLAPP